MSLRDINPIVGSFEGSLLAYSLGISNWHKKNSFCSNCGHKTIITKAGHQRNCLNKQCLNIHFPRTDPAVIMLIYKDDKILLGRQKVWPSGMYSTLAGFVETGETIENAVRREVLEEAGIKIKNIQYHSSQPWPFPASIMLGFYAEASSTKITLDENEVEDVQWFSRKEVINFTHQNKFLPRKISIARRLIDYWINETYCGAKDINVNIRLISSTSKNLQELVEINKFREDLYHRLNVMPIELSSLTSRTEDIPLLIDYFKRKLSEINGVQQPKIDINNDKEVVKNYINIQKNINQDNKNSIKFIKQAIN